MPTSRPRRAGRPRATAAHGRAPRPLPPGNSLFTPGASATRERVEHRSATALLWLHQLPAWLVPLLAVALLVAGLAVRGPGGAVALGALSLLLGWLALVSWPRLSAQGRALRVLTVAAVLVIAVLRATR